MRRVPITLLLLAFLAVLAGCALGNKSWPNPVRAQDRFTLHVESGERDGSCLKVVLRVDGNVSRFSAAGIQLEPVGSLEGQGCDGCPFMPRHAEYVERGDENFQVSGNMVTLTICTLEPETEYRFRIIGKNELNDMGSSSTDVYVAEP